MMKDWASCRNLLCVRADNMGDVLMSSPAIRSLKESFGCRITLLTSSMGAPIAKLLDCIDEVMCIDLPWIKSSSSAHQTELFELIETLRSKDFDGVIIFTVFSQNPLPSAMIMFLAGIPMRMAYCRENPYRLLTHWVPDKEPYHFMQHQVERDLLLAKQTGATARSEKIYLKVSDSTSAGVRKKLESGGIDLDKPWMIVHPGVSELKRQYPLEKWTKLCHDILSRQNVQFIISGATSEKELAEDLANSIGRNAISFAGKFTLEEYTALVDLSPLILSVNTGSIHIAAAVNTPVIVLYAMTNPQHTPWMVDNKVFYFPVSPDLESKNEVLKYIRQTSLAYTDQWPHEEEIVEAVLPYIRQKHHPQIL